MNVKDNFIDKTTINPNNQANSRRKKMNPIYQTVTVTARPESCATEEAPREVLTTMRELHEVVSSLTGALDILKSRLEPVLSSESKDTPLINNQRVQCQLATAIDSEVIRLTNMNMRVRQMISEIEL